MSGKLFAVAEGCNLQLHFATQNQVPSGLEFLRNALLKRNYCSPPQSVRMTYCEMLRAGDIPKLIKPAARPALEAAEESLRRFHLEYTRAGAYDSLNRSQRIKLLATVDVSMATPFVNWRPDGDLDPVMEKLGQIAAEQDAAVRAAIGPEKSAMLPPPLSAALAGPNSEKDVASVPEPVLIRYNQDGRREHSQKIVTIGAEAARVLAIAAQCEFRRLQHPPMTNRCDLKSLRNARPRSEFIQRLMARATQNQWRPRFVICNG